MSKTGTTTATIETDIPHTLTTGDWITAHGSTDVTNFPNLTVATVVASIIDSTHFTVVWGSSVTATSFGGAVTRVNGGNLPPAQTFALRGISRANGYMMIATSTTPTVLVGDTVRLVGVRDNAASIGIDDRYKVAHLTPAIWYGNTATSTIVTGIADTTLIPIGALVTGSGVPALAYIVSVQVGVGFTLSAATTTTVTNTPFTLTGMIVEAVGTALQPTTGGTLSATAGLIGGAVFKETDFRLHSAEVLDFNRTPVEVVSGINNNDIARSIATYLSGGTLTTLTTGNIQNIPNTTVVDVSSSVITTSTSAGFIFFELMTAGRR